MKVEEHIKALKLRKQGLTYAEIGKVLCVSKSTLSVWLKGAACSFNEKSAKRQMLTL